MKSEKYVICLPEVFYLSNSRNARKHLLEHDVDSVEVYEHNGRFDTLVCMARKENGIILVGAVRR